MTTMMDQQENMVDITTRRHVKKSTPLKCENRVLQNLNLNKVIHKKQNDAKSLKSEGNVLPAPAKPSVKNFKNIKPKIDTGLRKNKTVDTKVPNEGQKKVQEETSANLAQKLRREESTASHAHRATIEAKVSLKEINKKNTESKCKEGSHKEDQKTVIQQSTNAFEDLTLEDSNSKYGALLLSSFELPKGVDDVDADDENRTLAMSDYVKDIYKYLRHLESCNRVKPDHLKDQTITPKMRSILVDWLVTVQSDFSLLLETIQLTVAIIDRYLQIVTDIPRNKLQLVGLSALLLACKYEEIYAPSLDDFTFICDNAFTSAEIVAFEKHIFKSLGFKLAIPLPIHFLRRYMKIACGKVVTHHMAKYFIDLCLLNYNMACVLPSELAASALCLATFVTQEDDTCFHMSDNLMYFSEYNLLHLKHTLTNMIKVALSIDTSKLKGVYEKYSDGKFAHVSKICESKKLRLKQAYYAAKKI